MPKHEAWLADWVRYSPEEMQAQSNLGVVYEREGRIDLAKSQYENTARLFPKAADAVYNLGVMAWKQNNWPAAADYFAETLRRQPSHPSAAHYLEQARARMGQR
jgi:Flp pilus assembly protein TadD